MQDFWKMEAVYKIAGEILNQSNLQNHLDLLKMEAQLQEQQSRDKEIKAVSKIYFENMFFIPKILKYWNIFPEHVSVQKVSEKLVHRRLQDCPKKSWKSTKVFSPSLTGAFNHFLTMSASFDLCVFSKGNFHFIALFLVLDLQYFWDNSPVELKITYKSNSSIWWMEHTFAYIHTNRVLLTSWREKNYLIFLFLLLVVA